MQEKQRDGSKKLAYNHKKSQKQLALESFETPFEVELAANNRWVKLSQCIPWGELASDSSESIINAWPACKRHTLGNWRGHHQT